MTTRLASSRATAPSIAIDRIRCDGHGMCAELLPELITLDDWGYPVVAAGPVPLHLVELARRASAVCPVVAFRLQAPSPERMPRPRRQEAHR